MNDVRSGQNTDLIGHCWRIFTIINITSTIYFVKDEINIFNWGVTYSMKNSFSRYFPMFQIVQIKIIFIIFYESKMSIEFHLASTPKDRATLAYDSSLYRLRLWSPAFWPLPIKPLPLDAYSREPQPWEPQFSGPQHMELLPIFQGSPMDRPPGGSREGET